MRSIFFGIVLSGLSFAGDISYDGSVFDSLGTPALGARVRSVRTGLSTAAGPDGGWKLHARLDSLRDSLPDTLDVSWNDSSPVEARLPQTGRLMTGIVVLLARPAHAAGSANPSASTHPHRIVPPVEGDSGTVTDSRDGRAYRWSRIGGRAWFAENLAWKTDGSWWYGGREELVGAEGRLYSGRAVLRATDGENPAPDARLCPEGWRLPTSREWDTLESHARGSGQAGSALRTFDGWKGWFGKSTGTDVLGFHASPGGYRYPGGEFAHRGSEGFWWVAPDRDAGLTHRSLRAFDGVLRKGGYSRWFALSVRCVEDLAGGVQ